MDFFNLCDPFELAFKRCIPSGHIRSEQDLEAFRHALQEDGLLTDDEVFQSLSDEFIKKGRAFRPDGQMKMDLTFPEFQRLLVDRFSPDMEEVTGHMGKIGDQACILEEMLLSWDLTEMDNEETRQLLLILTSLDEKRINSAAALKKMAEENAYALMMQKMWGLITAREKQGSSYLKTGNNNPFQWQCNHVEEVEKSNRTKKVRQPRFTSSRKHGPRGVCYSDDWYSLTQGHVGRHGVRLHLANDKGTNNDIFVLAVPSNAPYDVTSSILNTYTAYRELTLTPGVIHALGTDCSNREESLYYYEYVPVTSASELLSRYGKPLAEESRLFRHWARELATALQNVQEQSCHELLNKKLDLTNVGISGKGLKLRLIGLQWGPQITPFYGESDEVIRRRGQKLVRGLGRILEQMLGLSQQSCWNEWYTNNRELVTKKGEGIDQYTACQGLVVREGDEVQVSLESEDRRYLDVEVSSEALQVRLQEDRDGCVKLIVRGIKEGDGKVICKYYELESMEQVILFVTVPIKVVAVKASARLKAILQFCQLYSHEAPGFSKVVAKNLMEEKWETKLEGIQLTGLLRNEYFAKPPTDQELEDVMEEYENMCAIGKGHSYEDLPSQNED